MKILFFGRGAIGTQYAWAFEKTGHTVVFYVREGRSVQYGPYVDLKISDGRRKKRKTVQERFDVSFIEEIDPEEKYDLIFFSINPEQVKEAAKYLAPRVGDSTVLFFNNFGNDPYDAMLPIPKDQIVVGFPGAGGGYDGNKLYGNLFKGVQLGIKKEAPDARERMVLDLFASSGFKTSEKHDIQNFLINHYVANAAMEAEVIKAGSFKNVADSKEALTGMFENIREMIPYLKAKNVTPDLSVRLLALRPPRAMAGLLKMTLYSPKSMAYEALAHNGFKAGYAVKEIVGEADELGVSLPRLKESLEQTEKEE